MSVPIGRVPPSHPMDYRRPDAPEPSGIDRLSGIWRERAHELSRRELEVFEVYCQTDTTEEAAARLGISAHTVKGHLTRIFRLLGVTNARQAAYLLWGPPSRR